MVDHFPSALPQIGLNGRYFYIRSGSLGHSPSPRDVRSEMSLSGARRRMAFIKPKEWAFRVSCRNLEERDYLISLVTDMSYQTYNVSFDDGITDASYNVVIASIGEFAPILNNVEAWDVDINLVEWV